MTLGLALHCIRMVGERTTEAAVRRKGILSEEQGKGKRREWGKLKKKEEERNKCLGFKSGVNTR